MGGVTDRQVSSKSRMVALSIVPARSIPATALWIASKASLLNFRLAVICKSPPALWFPVPSRSRRPSLRRRDRPICETPSVRHPRCSPGPSSQRGRRKPNSGVLGDDDAPMSVLIQAFLEHTATEVVSLTLSDLSDGLAKLFIVDERLRAALANASWKPSAEPGTAVDIADRLDVSIAVARRRLSQLREAGAVTVRGTRQVQSGWSLDRSRRPKMKKPRRAHSQERAIASRMMEAGPMAHLTLQIGAAIIVPVGPRRTCAARRRLAQTGATGSGAATAAAPRVARLSSAGGPCPCLKSRPEDRARPLLDHGSCT